MFDPDGNPNETGRRPNRLIHEKSPYLLQHAYNPVDWFPWREDAFEKARRENKPVFLSIGYSTCHWCHVMERESFEDPETAALMNEVFIPIKVDREERPDLDNVYMTVCRLMTGGGGWPLTVVMTPAGEAFFAATYIPRESGLGRTGMKELIKRIDEAWKTRRGEVLESAAGVTEALRHLEKEEEGPPPDLKILHVAFRELSGRFDKTYGGFGSSPKFPTPHTLSFLVRYWKRTGNGEALAMVEKTLRRMRHGGIFDQIGYGFHRYSTDRKWLVPHFEKMLYDQAMLAIAYLEACQATGDDFYGDTAREIFTYVLRSMHSPEGGFHSAEDADSEGVEGKFYLWSIDEIRRILTENEADLIIDTFQIREEGNFADEATGKPTGSNIFHHGHPGQETGIRPRGRDAEIMDTAIAKLFEVREKRAHPHKDDKILTDWNGLMIAALARGAKVLGEQSYGAAARGAVSFVMDSLRSPEGRLLHRYRDGDSGITANVDDYAFFIWGLIELHEAFAEKNFLETAAALSADLMEHYWDRDKGGFFFTPDDGETLIIRKKEIYDGAIPSGNAVAMQNFLRLSDLTGKEGYSKTAFEIAAAFSGQICNFPSGYTQLLCSIDSAFGDAGQ